MADLTAFLSILVLLGLSYPCMLAAGWVLFPSTVERARLRLEHTPLRCFWLGAAGTALAAVPILGLNSLPAGPAKLLAWTLAAALLGLAGLGGAGWSLSMGARLLPQSTGSLRGLLLGAAVSELAAIFPLVGWVVFFPFTLLATLGASIFAILRWMPAQQPRPAAVETAALPGTQA